MYDYDYRYRREKRYADKHQWDDIIDELRQLGYKDGYIRTYLRKHHNVTLHRRTIRRTIERLEREQPYGTRWIEDWYMEMPLTPDDKPIPPGYTGAQKRLDWLYKVYSEAETEEAKRRLLPYIEMAQNKLRITRQ